MTTSSALETAKKKEHVFFDIFRKLVGDANNTEIAKKIGVSGQTVSNWLSQKFIPDIIALEKIANAYHVSCDYLLGRTPIKSIEPDVQQAASYTGLTEKAIENLHKAADEWRAKAAISCLLEDDEKLHIFENISIILFEDFETNDYEKHLYPDSDCFDKIRLKSTITNTVTTFDPALIIDSECYYVIGYLKDKRKEGNDIYLQYQAQAKRR